MHRNNGNGYLDRPFTLPFSVGPTRIINRVGYRPLGPDSLSGSLSDEMPRMRKLDRVRRQIRCQWYVPHTWLREVGGWYGNGKSMAVCPVESSAARAASGCISAPPMPERSKATQEGWRKNTGHLGHLLHQFLPIVKCVLGLRLWAAFRGLAVGLVLSGACKHISS